MSVFVKICGLRHAGHVTAAIDAGADALGFVFAESVRRIDPQAASRITQAVPACIRRVAVMLHPTNSEWRAVLHGFVPDVLQTDAEDFAALDIPDSVTCWPVHREATSPQQPRGTYVYEGPTSGQGETVDWSRAADVASNGNMILAGGLTSANVAEAISIVRPFGVDVSSAVESEPGQKDARLIAEFINAAKAAEKKP